MIYIVDYGAGNLTSVLKGLRAAGAVPVIARAPQDLAGAAGIVIPGVGHYGATRSLDREWRAAIGSAIGRGVPLLGICLGMQWLYEGSDEAPDAGGLGIFEGRVFRLSGAVKVPHVGWNALRAAASSPLLADVSDGAEAYFTHGYAAPIGFGTIALTHHGEPFASIVARDNVCGMQFHPEKSGRTGITLLRNWVASRALKGRVTHAL